MHSFPLLSTIDVRRCRWLNWNNFDRSKDWTEGPNFFCPQSCDQLMCQTDHPQHHPPLHFTPLNRLWASFACCASFFCACVNWSCPFQLKQIKEIEFYGILSRERERFRDNDRLLHYTRKLCKFSRQTKRAVQLKGNSMTICAKPQDEHRNLICFSLSFLSFSAQAFYLVTAESVNEATTRQTTTNLLKSNNTKAKEKKRSRSQAIN